MAIEKTPEGWAVEVPDEDHMGPAMKRLNERQRRYVCALGVYGGNQIAAYTFAGYICSNDNSAHASASRLANTEAVQEAIREEAWRRMNYSTLLGVCGMIELASPSNPDKASRLKAIDMLTKRNGFHEKSEHLVVHEDRRTTKELMDAISTLAIRNGLDPKMLTGNNAPQLPAPIDAEFEEVSAGSDGIEDLL